MKRRFVILVIAILAITASMATFYRGNGSSEAPQYTTAVVVRGDVVETVEATGTLGAVTTVQVGTQVSGTIKSLHADFNSEVRKGQVIARLDASLFEAQVDQAAATVARLEADVDRARVSLEDAQVKQNRARELFSRGLIPAAEVETTESTLRQAQAAVTAARAQVTQARAALNQNRVNLSHTVITSPVDGIVISRNVDVGQTVAASMSAPTLFVIANDLTEMQVEASVDEANVGRIKPELPVRFRVDAYPNDTFPGVVSQLRLAPVVAQNVVTYVTVIDVANAAGKLKPGMTASVTIEIARAENVLKVPNGALRFQPPAENGAPSTRRAPGEARIWTFDGRQLQRVPLRLGITDGSTTAVIDGALAENTPVVVGTGSAKAAPSTASRTSPLMPQGPRGNRPGPGGG